MTSVSKLIASSRRVVGTGANNLVALNGSGKVPAVPGDLLTGMAISKYGKSPEINIVLAGTFSVAHGLGKVPRMVTPYLLCKTEEGGWLVDDKVLPHAVRVVTSGGFTVAKDATNLTGRFGSATNGIVISHKTTGADFTLTIANWCLVLEYAA